MLAEGIPPEVLNEPSRFIESLQKGCRLAEKQAKTGRRSALLLCKDIKNKPVIVKLYRPGLSPSIEVARALKNHKSANLIEIIDYGSVHNLNYEIIQYASGGTLVDQVLKKGPFSDDYIEKNILPQLYQGLTNLEKMKIIHGDLKPGNIYLTTSTAKELLIGDFGSALYVASGTTRISSPERRIKEIRGTPGYMAPEMFYGQYDLEKSDYYSLGFVLLFLYLGKHPYKGMPIEKIKIAHCKEELFLPQKMGVRFKNLLNGLLCKNPTERWGAEEVARWLEPESSRYNQGTSAKTAFCRIGNSVATNEKELAKLMKKHPELAKQGLRSGKIFKAIEKCQPSLAKDLNKIYIRANNTHLAYLEIMYTLDPNLPYTFMPGHDVTTLDALAKSIDKDMQSWKEGIKQLKNGSLITWFKATGRNDVIKEWERISKNIYSNSSG